MMLEGLVAWVLNNYLGKYVENLNTDQLSVALLSGKVELENLPLKKDALRHLGLPVEIKAGFIGKVQLQVPVRQIRSAPWLIAIEKLYLVATPVNLDEWDGATEAQFAHERKVALLDAMEAQWRAELEASDPAGYYASSYSSWLSYGTGLLANIVENLQLKLNDVHIRYEDNVTSGDGSAFACGLTVEALGAESCDCEWRRGFTLLADPAGCSYKLLELHKLAIYWDPMPVPNGMLAHCNIQELTERMGGTLSVGGRHRLVLPAVSAHARVRRERTEQPLRSRARPRLAARLTLDTVLLNLTKRQYCEAVRCVSGLERISRLRELRARRPAAPVRGHARDWWIYALSHHLPSHPWTEPRPTWESCVAAARASVAYVATCLATLTNPAATLPPDLKAAKDEFEWRTPLHVLKALREVAMRKVPKSTPVSTPDKPSSGRSMLVHWFPQWWGWYSPPPADTAPAVDPAPASAPAAAPPDLEEEILDVIADSLDNNTLLKRDTVFGKFEFVLNKGSLNLSMDDGDDEHKSGASSPSAGATGGGRETGGGGGGQVELQFSLVRVEVESRPRAAAHALAVSLGALCLRDRVTPHTLFPYICAPQGVIREGLSATPAPGAGLPWGAAQAASPPQQQEPLFQLSYEKKPRDSNCDYKLWVKSESIEVVYCPEVARWARAFVCAPWEGPGGAGPGPGQAWAGPAEGGGAFHAYQNMRDSTRARLMTQWEHIMRASERGERRSWQVELDISAPQILFAELLSSRSSAMLLVDFGRLRLTNCARAAPPPAAGGAEGGAEEEDEETFMTPCSTPPGSLLSPASPPLQPPAHHPPPLDAQDLHDRVYDRYKMELSSLQILVGVGRDKWQFCVGQRRAASALHLVERFSIAAWAERRAVPTQDPRYPHATLRAHLPKLVAHLSEHKLKALRAVLASLPLPTQHYQSSPPASGDGETADEEASTSSETERSDISAHHNSTLLMLQFAVDQMSLEVQSRGRSIAEVQVCGVRVCASRRARDASLSLSVHSLLLVDALQTYGPDFELLVASHKHVGMDTTSGSILGSEPTSPTSPTSPASPNAPLHVPPHAHPLALSQALYSLHQAAPYNTAPDMDRTSPAPNWPLGTGASNPTIWGPNPWSANTWGNNPWDSATWETAASCNWGAAGLVDSEALIAVELTLVKGDGDGEDLRIANILFNNLDIIANQETIVELIGFTQRVFAPQGGQGSQPDVPPVAADPPSSSPQPALDTQRCVRTEVTFDFHRLGVLVVRAALPAGVSGGGAGAGAGAGEGGATPRKIATATLCDARIQATIDGGQLSGGGSLGGVHVVSLCERGVHTRVLSAGRPAPPAAPLPPRAHVAAHPAPPADDDKALLFNIERTVLATDDENPPVVSVKVGMNVARVWYTHSPALLLELHSCLAEFKQYLADLARSIRAAAADMAIGLVNPRESLYINPKLCQSSEGVSPRRRTMSVGVSLDEPADLDSENIVLSVSIELESPVVVIPRGAESTEVVVAHLGRMSLSNRPGPPRRTLYNVRVRDISLSSLDVADTLSQHVLSADSMQQVYDVSRGTPVLHNTALKVCLNLGDVHQDHDLPCQCVVSGGVVGPLQVSARRAQYEQLLATVQFITQVGGDTAAAAGAETHDASGPPPPPPPPPLEPAVPTLRLDPAVRAAVLSVPPPTSAAATPPHLPPPAPSSVLLQVNFELPMFSVELRADLGEGERSLVELSFREFALSYKRTNQYETTLQVSLHSITMEDLTKEPDSKHRLMMVSHTPQMPPKAVFVSKSCPDFLTPASSGSGPTPEDGTLHQNRTTSRSLPSQLNILAESKERLNKRQDSKCGPTPPCSPECGASTGPGVEGPEEEGVDEEGLSGDDNLVWVWVHTRDPQHPHFHDKFNKVCKLTKVEFNSLNLVVSIDSWVAVLDFFGVAGDEEPDSAPPPDQQQTESSSSGAGACSGPGGVTQTEMSISCLCVVVVAPSGGEACRALVRRVRVAARAAGGASGAREVRGRLGALLLSDLTPHAPLWRDRLRTHPQQALTFHYHRLSAADAEAAGYETSLKLEMGPVSYVHTRRFVSELQAFARDFSLLRRVIAQARLKVSAGSGQQRGGRCTRMSLHVSCEATRIVLPVSGRARAALVAHLAALQLTNCFKRAGDPGTVSTLTDPDCQEREWLDVRSVAVSSLTLVGAARGRGRGGALRLGPPLLTAPAHLTLAIEHNLSATHNVPDMTVQGTLTTLECTLDPAQYRLVRGVLAHNLAAGGEDLPPHPHPHHTQQVWTTSSLKLELQDVKVRLEPQLAISSLACINFIKSRLVVETYSDLGRDIDLVSQEILVTDTRYCGEPANRRGNVFTNIVQPMPDHRHSVQAEVHARNRRDSSAYTILVNNMRLMAVLDWWEGANQFIMQPPHPEADPDQPPLEEPSPRQPGLAAALGPTEAPAQTELKLNITDSQLVLVEDASVWDTNAVILRSTTVITYRLADTEKPVSCSLNELEVFSCVLGLEEETALSIVEPASLHVAIDAHKVLHMSTGTLSLRLSYHDMRMFAAMLHSLPLQARAALSGNPLMPDEEKDAPANSVHMRAGSAGRWTGGMGGAGGKWARVARPPPSPPPQPPQPHPPSPIWPLKAVQVNAECITLCVIDDCLDSDVPLLEVALADLHLEQDLRKVEEAFEDPMLVCTPAGPASSSIGSGGKVGGGSGAGGGRLSGVLSIDYYNRTLSGWEPAVEPWRFETSWEYTLSTSLSLARVQVNVTSEEILNTNVTSSLLSLWQLVRSNWAADYYAPQGVGGSGSGAGAEQSPKGSPAGHRRRSPFVPYALRNHTGHRLWFTTLITTSDLLQEQTTWSGPDDSWQGVRAGDTEPFSFGARRGAAARGAGGARRGAGVGLGAGAEAGHQLHQLALRLDNWDPPDPVCVDRVGVFFRHLTHAKTGAEARIVFEVSLEGSARKLVTVRSALRLLNKLPHAVEVRCDHAQQHNNECTLAWWAGSAHSRRQSRAASVALHRARALRAALRAPPAPLRHTHPMFLNCAQWAGGGVGVGVGVSPRSTVVEAGGVWAAPLAARPGVVWARPVVPRGGAPPAGPAALDWRAAGTLLHAVCRAPPDHVYRFCCVIIRERFPPDKGPAIAGHTLTLVPALRLENLLPLELTYRVSGARGHADRAAPPGDTVPFHQVNLEEGVELSVKLEGFGWSTPLSVGGAAGGGAGGGSFSARLKLRDSRGRRLYLNARVSVKKTDGLKVSISAAYWLVNRTGLPLVFRAEGGAAGEAAGQFAEHEVARMVAPLLFSFHDVDSSPTLAARLGTALSRHPEWCSPFGLGPGVGVKKLVARGEAEGGSGGSKGGGGGGGEGSERVYCVGVSVRSGRGRYRHTNICTLTPRYQLHNNTHHHLQFAQHCTATTLTDPGAMATHVSAVAGCYLPWHWARWDRPHLLCVRVLQPPGAGAGSDPARPATAWSGGFRVDSPRSLHIACREGGGGGGYQLVRVEVAVQGATLFVVLTDAECAPPPIAIHNYSPVSIMFHQVGCSEECAVGAHGWARWALPEPEGAGALALRAPGGPRATLPLAALGATTTLLYQNFIYVCFTSTVCREKSATSGAGQASGGGDDNALVLEVPLGSTRVVLARKRYGDRCQLWRRGPNEQLIHEGSSVPQPTDVLLSDDSPLSPHSMVLDIEEAAPRPGRASALVLRRADPRRASTQAWRLHAGRMACAHANLCVQPDSLSLQGLQQGARVVLGLPSAGRGGGGCGIGAGGAVPPEQAVSWHTLRPGSGRLAVTLSADGPTRKVTIRDQRDPESGWIEGSEAAAEAEAGVCGEREWGLGVRLAGLSVSVVARAELVHAQFRGVALALARAPRRLHAALSVADMQWDNQLLGTTSPVLLQCSERSAGTVAALSAALELQRTDSRRYNAYFFKHLCIALTPIAVHLEERLILELWSWAWAEEEEALEQPDEAEFETRRMLDELTALHATRYYFALIKVMPSQIRLSMTTTNKLEGSLYALKRRLGLTFIKFEDACVELEPFVRAHVFDTASYLARQMLAHFKDELKWQAAKILGSVDFLGNPLGFVADVSEGVSGLLLEGNVAALLKNVTHGISNSAAKVSESLGDGLERVVGDEAHEETRRRIRSAASGGGAHLAAGLRGLSLGLLGGITSLVKHTYEGATNDGVQGFFAGVGKGLVGTVTKPVIGVLDLAAETASALRESARGAARRGARRVRGPRAAWGAGGLLPPYCAAQAQGAALLYALNGADYSERFLAYRPVRDRPHDIRALLSDSYLRIFTCKHTHAAPHLVMETHLSNLVSCTVVQSGDAWFVELGVRGGGGAGGGAGGSGGGGGGGGEGGVRRPRVQCDSAELCAWVARHAAYARQLYYEHVHTLAPHTDTDL